MTGLYVVAMIIDVPLRYVHRECAGDRYVAEFYLGSLARVVTLADTPVTTSAVPAAGTDSAVPAAGTDGSKAADALTKSTTADPDATQSEPSKTRSRSAAANDTAPYPAELTLISILEHAQNAGHFGLLQLLLELLRFYRAWLGRRLLRSALNGDDDDRIVEFGLANRGGTRTSAEQTSGY